MISTIQNPVKHTLWNDIRRDSVRDFPTANLDTASGIMDIDNYQESNTALEKKLDIRNKNYKIQYWKTRLL